jgi:carboxyl-terminal processing protease
MKRFKISVTIITSIFIGFFSAVSFSQIELKKLTLEDKNFTDNQKEFFDEVISRVKKDYVEEKSDRELYEAAADGLLSSLDPHSSYLSEGDLKEMQVQTRGEFGGIGIEITLEKKVVKVISAIEGTPAFRAGIKSGDYILKVNKKSLVDVTIDEAVKNLRGKPRTRVTLTILRKGEKEPLKISMKRKIIKVKPVKASKFKDVAYIKIKTFSEKTSKNLKSELKKLKDKIGEENFKGLVLDLRNNPGGLLDQAINVSDIFLDEGKTIVSISTRNKTESKIYNDKENEALIKSYPIVVLINEGSASASEIVAGALQDNKRAIIMGTRSFGKGSVQTIIPLSKNKGAIRLTTSLYYTPSGKSIQAHGIDPDIAVISAKIEKEKSQDRDFESDLKGHIEAQNNNDGGSAKRAAVDETTEIYGNDYQLTRAVDLIRGLRLNK